MKSDETDKTGKKASNYPYFPLNSCLKVSEAVKDLGGARAEIQKSVLAKQLGDSEKSGTFSQRITSTKCYGLIDGHGAYSLTEAAKRYYFPTNDLDKAGAMLSIFSTPPAFQALLRRFDGDRLPTKDILANILHRDLGVPESWMDRVASFFVGAAQMIEVIDSQGFLRFNAARHGTVSEEAHATDEPSAVVQEAKGPIGKEAQILAPKPGTNLWSFSQGGKTVHLQTPEDINLDLWSKLEGYVKLLKPNDYSELLK